MKKKKAGKKGKKKTEEAPAAATKPKKKGKEARSWDMGGKSTEGIDFSSPAENGAHNLNVKDESHLKGTMSGDLTGVGEEDDEEYEEDEEDTDISVSNGTPAKSAG